MSRLITGLLLSMLFTLYAWSCVVKQPSPEDNKPQCCRGQESHTCEMPDMTDKPLEK